MSFSATEHRGLWSNGHAGFTQYSKFLRENFNARHTQFVVSSMSSGNTLELSGSDSEVEYIEAIGKEDETITIYKPKLH